MPSKERGEIGGFIPSEYMNALNLRMRNSHLPRLSDSHVNWFLRTFGRREGEFLEFVYTQPDLVKSELARNKLELTAIKGGIVPSRANLTAQKILDGVYIPALNATMECYQDPKLSRQVFAGYFDFSSGIIDVVKDIFEAEQYIEGATGKIISEGIELTRRNQEMPISDATAKLMYQKSMTTSQKLALLLEQDPDGFTIIRNAVAEISYDAEREPGKRRYHRILDFQEPRFVVEGAEFAQRAYLALYPYTE